MAIPLLMVEVPCEIAAVDGVVESVGVLLSNVCQNSECGQRRELSNFRVKLSLYRSHGPGRHALARGSGLEEWRPAA